MVSVVFSQNTCVFFCFFLISHIFKTFFPAFSCIFFALGYKLTLTYFGRSLNTNFLLFLKKLLLVYANHPYFYWKKICTNGIFCHKFCLSFFWADFGFSFSFFWKKILKIFTLVLGRHLMQDPSQDAHN